jgi:hypothetical protein
LLFGQLSTEPEILAVKRLDGDRYINDLIALLMRPGTTTSLRAIIA